MEFKRRSAKNLRWIFTISQILGTLRLYTGVGVDLGLCSDQVFQCQCGADPNVKISIPVKQCSYIYRWEPYCKPCNKLKENDICPRFLVCKLCEKDKCTACPFNKFGQWCEKDCKCLNWGDCDINGFCQCPNGYEGRYCETKSGCRPSAITPPLMETRVPLNQPLLIEYQCPTTHELIGFNRVSCLLTRDWSHPPPTCAMRCDIHDFIPNGLISTTRKPVLSGDAVQFSCSQGYSLFGATSANCGKGGKMDRELPVCVKVSACNEPLKVLKSSREISLSVPQVTDRYFNGTIIKYQCEKGYFMFGKSEIICLFSGHWNLPPPTCVKVPESAVTCDTIAEEIVDENGVTVIVQCPPGCAITSYPVYGTVIYHYHSSICRAALHSGKITNKGGIVFLTNSGHSDFLSSTLNGIKSRAKPGTEISFKFTRSPDENYFNINVVESSSVNNNGSTSLNCPTGWTTFNEYCYIYVENAKSFEMSRITCHNLGTRLPNLKDSEFLSSVKATLDKTKGLNVSWLVSKRNANHSDSIIVWKGKNDHPISTEFDHALDHHDSPSGHCTLIESRERYLVWKIQKCHEPAPFFCVHNPKDYVEKNCEDPGHLLNGYAEFEGEIKSFQIGAVIKYHCAELHYLSGDTNSVCSKNATWTNPKPRCIKLITCSYPPIPKYGHLKVLPRDKKLSQKSGIKRSRIGIPNFARKSTTFLKNGKTINTNQSKRITNATLLLMAGVQRTHLARKSKPVIMKTPVSGWGRRIGLSPNNVSVEPLNSTNTELYDSNENKNSQAADNVILPKGHYRVGTRVSYACESRYYDFIGSQSRRCQSDGTWSGRSVTCVPVCGRLDSPKMPFIKNGNATEVGQWPWQVGLSQFLKKYDLWYLHCGGSLISESLVLTAAHCVTTSTGQKFPLTILKFHFGKYHRNNELDDDLVQERGAKEIHVHHNYDPKTFDSDIAVVLLDVPVTLTSRVQPICLPTDRSTRVNIVDGTKGVVTGWGRLDEEGEDSETLQQAVIPVVGHEKCQKGYQSAGLRLISVSENMFCAGYERGNIDACPGDSGGPMVFQGDSAKKFVLEGIVSWGSPNGCGQPQQYGVFTWVHKFLPWIQQLS